MTLKNNNSSNGRRAVRPTMIHENLRDERAESLRGKMSS